LFGGIRHPHTIGSGAVLFYYRWRALQNIQRLGLESEYDWFIVTRSDFLYPVQHVPLSLLSQDSVWIPNGENYGGVTDRYLICPSKFIERSIDMLKYILTKPDDFFTNYKRWLHGKGANPETFIAFYLEKQGIPVQFVPYFMYTIRELDEIPNPTQFGGAGTKRYKDTNYSIKYPDEKQAADKLSIETPSDWERYIPQPSAI
jgi:hypothetical protein